MQTVNTPGNPESGRLDANEVRRRADLVSIVRHHVELRREGREHVGRCPFHSDDTPSFHVYLDDAGISRWKCFGCQLGGDVLDFLQRIESLTFGQALERAAGFAGMPQQQAPAKPKRKTRWKDPDPPQRVVATYPYVDAGGAVLYEIVRIEPGEEIEPGGQRKAKTFKQRSPDGRGGWNYGRESKPVLFRLPNVLKADSVFITEGEKDVLALEALGIVATTNSEGAGKWRSEYAEHFRGKVVTVCPDTDETGRKHGADVIQSLAGIAREIRVVKLPEMCKDVTDFVAAGMTLIDLGALAELVPTEHLWVKGTNDSRSYQTSDSAGETATPPHTFENGGGDWRAHLEHNKDRNPRPVMVNAIAALEYHPQLKGVLQFNEFSQDIIARKGAHLPWSEKPLDSDLAWTDQEDRVFTTWLQRQGIFVHVFVASQAVQTVARQHSFHPVREYLGRLEWDGTPRIDKWLTAYLGAEETPYTTAIGARWLISAVARVIQPGCQVDHALVLEGDQGIRKSTALRVLAGDDFFTDQLAELGTKDSALETAGVWVIELAELEALGRSDTAKVKAFVVRRTDRFRPPYGRLTIKLPRQCVFAATVNPNATGTYACFRDETGGRRFWPVRCSTVDIDALQGDRDQLWAEAVSHYYDGAAWWLEERELIQAAMEQQAQRFEGDPWDTVIGDWLEHPCPKTRFEGQSEIPIGPYSSQENSVSIADILMHAIGKPQKDWTRADEMRVARSLTVLKWERYRTSVAEGRKWMYRKKV